MITIFPLIRPVPGVAMLIAISGLLFSTGAQAQNAATNAPGSTVQTPVDRISRALDSLSTYSLQDWKASPDLKNPIEGDPTSPGFDDSRWETVRLDQRIFPDSCWLRKTIRLPEKILGRPVAGPVRLILSVDDYGFLWVNGESKGYFPWDGDFELTANALPGEKFTLAIKAINTGGPLRIIRASLEAGETRALKDEIAGFVTSIRVGQKLLGFDTYQTNSQRKVDPGIDKSTMDRAEKTRLNELLQSAAAKVDVEALAGGKLERFSASLAEARGGLKPVGAFAKRYTLWFDANAHIDAAWLWREGETVQVCRNTFTSVLDMMDARPDFTYTQSSAAYYDWMERLYPEVFSRIEQRVRDGRWEIVGGMWVEPDCNLPGGESWARHLLYGKRYFRKKFGKDVGIGYNPDSFGYNWNMPQFYLDAGIDAFVTQKIGWNERTVFPHRLFWWEAPDGSRILAYFPFDYVNTIDNPFRLTEQLRQFEANTGLPQVLTLFGVGDHGGGPTPEMLARLDRLTTLDVYPNVKLAKLGDYLGWLKSNDLSQVPVWKDELYLEYHQGTYTTQAKIKKSNRLGETLLLNAEKFSAIAALDGRPYPAEDLQEAWEHVLFNQFHDILPGSGIGEIYIDAGERYGIAREIGEHELDGSLRAIAGRVASAAKGGAAPLTVFNPLAWQRSGPVSVALPSGDRSRYVVLDEKGRELPTQMLREGKYGSSLLFVAKDVPSMGYRSYRLKNAGGTAAAGGAAGALKSTRLGLSNGILEVAIDSATGWVRSIRREGREVLAGEGNRLQLLEDTPRAWDAWNVGLTGVEYPTRLVDIALVEQGPVRATIRITREYLKPGVTKDYPTPDYPTSFFAQEISLCDGADYVEFRTDADWWEEKTMAKVAFPVAVRDTAATYEIPYGSIRRSTQWRNEADSARVEVPAQRWADLSEPAFGVSLLNRAKYGYDIKENVMRLSLLRSPKWPDPMADRGRHEMEYALYPHAGGWREAATVRRGYEFNNPLIAVRGSDRSAAAKPASGRSLPAALSFVTLEPENLVLTSVKRAEDSDAWIIQWYESEGRETEATLTLPRAPKAASLTGILEEERVPLRPNGKTVTAKTRAGGMITVKVSF